MLTLTGCRWRDPFPEYQGVNLIESRGLSVDSFTHAYMDGSDPASMFEYVHVSSVTAAEYGNTAGLPSGVEDTIRRLEAVNLFPDGDFEQSMAGLAPINWDIDSAVTPPKVDPATFTVDGSGKINGNSVEFSVAGFQAGVLDLDTHLLDGLVEPAIYFLNLQFIRSSPAMFITFDYGDDDSTTYLDNRTWIIQSRTDGETPVETLPTAGDPLLDLVTEFPASGTGNNYFYVGSPQSAPGQAGYVDNIRIGRLDPTPHVAAHIAAANDDGSLPLVTSTYRLSVYVKSEIADQVTPSANGHNRFRAGQIALGFNSANFILFTQDEVGWTTDTWQLVSADFELDDEDLTGDPPLQVRLTVIHPDSPVIGSVLIADPRLELASSE